MKLQKQIRSWRKQMNFTQSDAAEFLGMSSRTLQNWEQGKRTPQGLARKFLEDILYRYKRK